jgi:Uma2 family endonuclease
MTATHQLTEAEYIQLVFASPDRQLELYDGEVREKPGVSWERGDIAFGLGLLLGQQLDRRQFGIAINDWRVRPAPGSIYIPDLVVVPRTFGQEFKERPGKLAIFRDPLPLVVEIWSRSTGDYDVNAKIPEYRRRGDLEIWRIQPYERSITVWRRQPDGSYEETVYRDGIVRPASLPGVTISLAELFDVP